MRARGRASNLSTPKSSFARTGIKRATVLVASFEILMNRSSIPDARKKKKRIKGKRIIEGWRSFVRSYILN